MSKKSPRCPFLNKPCIEHECMMYTHVTMKNPQTGSVEDRFACALTWIPVLLVEGSNQTRHVQASVDSMRNEVVKRQDALNAAIDSATTGRLESQHEERNVVDVTPEQPRIRGDSRDVSSSESVER